MASSSRGMNTLGQFNDVEYVRSSFKPAKLTGSNSDGALIGRRPSPNSQAIRDYSWSTTLVNGGGYEDSNFLSRRHPGPSSRGAERPTTSRYNNCQAGVGVDQVNGLLVVCGPEACDYGLETPKGSYAYQDCIKEGSGVQVNGLDVIYYGSSSRVPKYPGMDASWDGVVMISGNDRSKESKSQINGGRIRRMGRTEEEMARIRQVLS